MNSKIPRSPVRVALLGAGDISYRHASALTRMSGIQVISVCDSRIARAKNLAEKFGIPVFVSSVADLYDDLPPDVVHVLTDPASHAALAHQCISFGSDVLVEKPLATSLHQCNELRSAADRFSRLCGVNHQLVYGAPMLRLIEEIRSFRLGGLLHVHVAYSVPWDHLRLLQPDHFIFRDARNVLFEFGSHPFSIIQTLLGNIIQCETLYSGSLFIRGHGIPDTWQIASVAERGSASLSLKLGKGPKHIGISVLGEDGTAELDLVQQTVLFNRPALNHVTGSVRQALRTSKTVLHQGFSDFYRHYASALRGSRLTGDDAFANSVSAFYSARATGELPLHGIQFGTSVVQYCIAAANNCRSVEQQLGAVYA